MSNPTTNQIKNKSSVAGNTVTEALNALLLVQGDGTGDMLKIVYDNNNNGKVDVAEVAEAVPWTGVTSKPATFPPQTHNHTISDVTSLQTSLDGKQATLESGVNIKTINGTSVLGSGNISISGGSAAIDDAITDGVTDRAPSQNAVFDALATKSATSHTHSDATTSVAGFMSSSDKTKLNGIATGATANDTDANLKNRANHTGTQPLSSLSQSGASTNQVPTWNGSAWIPSSSAGGGATIKAIQRGTISIPSGSTSATATITAVDMSKTELRFLGGSTYDSAPASFIPRVVLTNTTTITATISGTGLVNCVTSWELTEYN